MNENDEVGYLSIPNWTKYQAAQGPSKKGWVPPWIKVQVMTGDDFAFSQLTYEERGFLTELWKLAARTDNMIPEQTSWIANATQCQSAADRKKIAPLLNKLLFAGLLQNSRTDATPSSRKLLEQSRGEESREEGRTSLSSNGSTANVKTVFDYWKTTRNHPKARLGDERKRKIAARLREGFTVDELKLAVDGVALDPWEDRGRHDDIGVIFRNASQVEKFLGLHGDLTVLTAEERRERHLASLREKETTHA